MTLVPLTDKDEIRKAYNKFARIIRKGVEPVAKLVGYPSGSEDMEVYWHPEAGIWGCSDPSPEGNRYGCAFGIQHPAEVNKLNITCEINMPHEDIDRRIAGAFVKDTQGKLFITHSGKIGGGRKGISKTTFWSNYRGSGRVDLSWSRERETEAVLICGLDDPEAMVKIGHFTKEVARIKMLAVQPQTVGKEYITTGSFSPEFEGIKAGRRKGGTYEQLSNHALVTNKLAGELKDRGLITGSDIYRDCFIRTRSGKITILFETKTDLSTTSIYGAIGQLLFHGLQHKSPPKLVMVIPAEPDVRTIGILRKLDINYLRYTLRRSKVSFHRLDTLLE